MVRFLAHFGLIDRAGAMPEFEAQRRFKLLHACDPVRDFPS